MIQADVIVLGAGGMGSSAAYHLVKRGHSVVALEQFQAGHSFGSSHGESRIIRKAYFEHPDYVPLLKRAYELWAELERESLQRLYHETGIFYGLREGSEIHQGLLKSASQYQIPIENLSAQRRRKFDRWFHIPDEMVTLYEPEAGYLEIENCVRAYQTQATHVGARFYFGEKILRWSANPEGVSVETQGETYIAKKLVVAAGPWAAEILPDMNIPLHLLRKVSVWLKIPDFTEAPCYLFEALKGQCFYGFRDIGHGEGTGEVKCAEHSGGEKFTDMSKLSREVKVNDIYDTLEFARRHLKGTASMHARTSVCTYTMTPDQNFVIDRHPHYENVAVACGFSGHGFKFASVVGEILADLAMNGDTPHPIGFLRSGRFTA